ncbi:hypothetical protein FQA39_LY06361 [Lamprigera yunnana]|nr:hypothetical protein FQA39_LY06361 [Lamprigera yunnana]
MVTYLKTANAFANTAKRLQNTGNWRWKETTYRTIVRRPHRRDDDMRWLSSKTSQSREYTSLSYNESHMAWNTLKRIRNIKNTKDIIQTIYHQKNGWNTTQTYYKKIERNP